MGGGVAQEQESTLQEWVRAPIKWVRAPIKWVRAPMMMGAHPQGWGRAPIKWGRALLEKGLFQSVTMNLNLLIQHTVSRWCSSGCVHEGCGSVHHWLLTDHWSSWVCFYRQPSRQVVHPAPTPTLK